MRKAQKSAGINRPLSLLFSDTTRGSKYLAAKRLLQLEATIKQVSCLEELLSPDATQEQQVAANQFISIVQDNVFWSTLNDTSRILMPIVGLSYVLQKKTYDWIPYLLPFLECTMISTN